MAPSPAKPFQIPASPLKPSPFKERVDTATDAGLCVTATDGCKEDVQMHYKPSSLHSTCASGDDAAVRQCIPAQTTLPKGTHSCLKHPWRYILQQWRCVACSTSLSLSVAALDMYVLHLSTQLACFLSTVLCLACIASISCCYVSQLSARTGHHGRHRWERSLDPKSRQQHQHWHQQR